MTYTQERDEFIGALAKHGVPVYIAREILAKANRLQKLSELECSSEWANNHDKVMCSAAKYGEKSYAPCLCRDYGSFDMSHPTRAIHGTVPRFMVQEARIKRQLANLAKGRNFTLEFQGDPRGYPLSLWFDGKPLLGVRQVQVWVPAKGYTVAQMERICR